MKAPSSVRTVEEYLAFAPPKRQEILRAFHAAIPGAAPGLRPEICYGMIGNGVFDFKTKSGCEGEWYKAGQANLKIHISLYPRARDDDGYLVGRNKDRLGKVSTGKGRIRFTGLENLNLEVAMELVKLAAG